MNHFFALPVPGVIQNAIAALVVPPWRDLYDSDALRWYQPGDYHLTLKFLGDVSIADLAPLAHALQEIAAQTVRFTLQPATLGIFPQEGLDIRVLWIGVTAHASLARLAEQVNNAAASHGFASAPQPYTPHITLARARKHGMRAQFPDDSIGEQTFPKWPADSFALMRTSSPTERRNGADLRYTIVQTFPFAGQSPAR